MEPYERPQLRPDLELLVERPEEPGEVLLHDPDRRAIFELSPEDLPLVHLLDGQHSPAEIARLACRQLDEVVDLLDDLADLLLLFDPEQGELLDAWRRQHEEDDLLLQPALDSRPPPRMEPQAIQIVDDARHTCLRCGACCHYAVPISSEERRRLEEVAWPEGFVPERPGRLFQLRPGSQWGRLEETVATRTDPTRCAFLGPGNLCRAQEVLGPQGKPFSCRLFPLAFPVFAPEGVLFSLSFECPHIYRTYDTGARLAGRREELAALVAQMEEVYALPATVPMNGEVSLGLSDYLAWERAFLGADAAPATAPEVLLERLRRHWTAAVPLGTGPVLGPGDLADLAGALGRVARQDRDVLADSPEGEAGSVWAVAVLEALATSPGEAWASLPWGDGPAADLLLSRFIAHFVGGKQHLLYRSAAVGMRALVALLLLSRADAWMMAREAGEGSVSLAVLNRAVARWCRLLDVRPLRLSFLRSPTRAGDDRWQTEIARS